MFHLINLPLPKNDHGIWRPKTTLDHVVPCSHPHAEGALSPFNGTPQILTTQLAMASNLLAMASTPLFLTPTRIDCPRVFFVGQIWSNHVKRTDLKEC